MPFVKGMPLLNHHWELRRFKTGNPVVIPLGEHWIISSVHCIPPDGQYEPPFPDIERYRGDVVIHFNNQTVFRGNAREMMDRYWQMAMNNMMPNPVQDLNQAYDRIMQIAKFFENDTTQAVKDLAKPLRETLKAWLVNYNAQSFMLPIPFNIPEAYEVRFVRDGGPDEPLEIQLGMTVSSEAG